MTANDTRGLWRGKHFVPPYEWVEGLLTYRDFDPVQSAAEITVESGSGVNYSVNPETLGECTGLTDKNGKLIFEGDIVKTKKYGKVVGHSNVNDYDIFVVKYEPAMFRLKNHNRGFNLVDDGYSKLEVIGNIHDNPELLKGDGNEDTDSVRGEPDGV